MDHYTQTQHQSFQIRRVLATLAILSMLLLAACSTVGSGQSQSSKFTVGVVAFGSSTSTIWETTISSFKARMTELGYVEGNNIVYIYKGPVASEDQSEAMVRSLVQAPVDLLLVIGTQATKPAQKAIAGTDLPMLFYNLVDPVAAGLVKSVRNPGGNITGVTADVSVQGLRLEWLLKIAPNIKHVYLPYDPSFAAAVATVQVVKDIAPEHGVEIVTREVRTNDEVTTAIQSIPDNVDAVFLTAGATTVSRNADFVKAALKRKLPLSVSQDSYVTAGALVSYGPSDAANGKQLARLADHILKGAKPSDLPVETADYFLSINLKTAQAIELTIPDDVLRAANFIVR